MLVLGHGAGAHETLMTEHSARAPATNVFGRRREEEKKRRNEQSK
jgi:hypothetical protein